MKKLNNETTSQHINDVRILHFALLFVLDDANPLLHLGNDGAEEQQQRLVLRLAGGEEIAVESGVCFNQN